MVFKYDKTPDGDFKCIHCGCIKKNQSTMNMHYKANHMGTFKHKCKDCPYETSMQQNLDNHILAKHPTRVKDKPDPIECPHEGCEFSTHRKGGLRSHYLLKHLTAHTHALLGKTEEGLCQCTHCGLLFKSKPAFVYHVVGCLPPDILTNDIQTVLGF